MRRAARSRRTRRPRSRSRRSSGAARGRGSGPRREYRPPMDIVQVERADGIVTVTLNRPEKKNAINRPMWGAIRDTFRSISNNPDDRVVVLTGAKGEFCSGADITDADGAEKPVHQL